MIKRLLLLVFGLGFGVVAGAAVVKRLDDASRAVAPANVAREFGRAAGGWTARLRGVADQARAVAVAREAELRAEFRVPRARDLRGG